MEIMRMLFLFYICFHHHSSVAQEASALLQLSTGAKSAGKSKSKSAGKNTLKRHHVHGVPVTYKKGWNTDRAGETHVFDCEFKRGSNAGAGFCEELESSGGCTCTYHDAHFATVPCTNDGLKTILEDFSTVIELCEEDQELHLDPNEKQHNLSTHEKFHSSAATWGLDRIGADSSANKGVGVTVFVLDTGTMCTHDQFGGRCTRGLDMTTGVNCEDTDDTSCANDNHGHGTHCAGTVAGSTFGVAPEAKIVGVKVLSDSGSGSYAWIAGGLDWIADGSTRPAVASLSLGGSGTSDFMRDTVDNAVDAGVTVVVAAGNSNDDACFYSPAFVPSAITVGSTTSADSRSWFSNYGECLDVYAPGSSVLSCGITSDSSTDTMSGTSMACPHVAGGAALALAHDPTFTPSDVVEFISSSACAGVLSDMQTDDPNLLLYAGETRVNCPVPGPPTPAPPPPPPTPAPTTEVVRVYCGNGS